MKNLEYPIEVKTGQCMLFQPKEHIFALFEVYCLTPESCLECLNGEGTEK